MYFPTLRYPEIFLDTFSNRIIIEMNSRLNNLFYKFSFTYYHLEKAPICENENSQHRISEFQGLSEGNELE